MAAEPKAQVIDNEDGVVLGYDVKTSARPTRGISPRPAPRPHNDDSVGEAIGATSQIPPDLVDALRRANRPTAPATTSL